MKIIFDTHAFIWWDSNLTRLSDHALRLSHTLILSAASVWEMQIKLQLGKLRLQLPLSDYRMSPIPTERKTMLI